MSVNSGDIDLNSDVVPGEPMNDVYDVNMSEPIVGRAEGPSDEGVIDEIGAFGGLNNSAEPFGGSGAHGVDEHLAHEAPVGGSVKEEGLVEAAMESVDTGTYAKEDHSLTLPLIDALEDGDDQCRNEVVGCSDCSVKGHELSLGAAPIEDISVARIARIDGGLVLKSKDDNKNECVEDGTAKGSAEANAMGAVDAGSSIGLEIFTDAFYEEAIIGMRREKNLEQDGDEEKGDQETEKFSGEVEGDQNMNFLSAKRKLIQRYCTSLNNNLGNGVQLERDIKFVSLPGGAEGNSLLVTKFVDHLSAGVPGIDVKAVNTNNSLSRKDQDVDTLVSEVATRLENQAMEVKTQIETDDCQIVGVPVSEAGGSQNNNGSVSAMAVLAVDFNQCNDTDVNQHSEAGISSERSWVKEISHGVKFSVSDCLGENTPSDANVFGSNGNQNIVVEEEITDAEQLNDIEMKNVKPAASGPECYEKDGFLVSDLVWGKVRSHPWWPGQIFEPSASSDRAMKYFKRESFLIAYFGDQTFAWNDASRLKPFRTHFSQMEKQSNLEAFRHAVDCALDEVSRRVECGLACSCMPEEAYAQIKSQIMISAGIREESSRRDGGDRFSGITSFEPMKLVECVKSIAHFPCSEIDRLELVVLRAQLLSFYRWKGYSQLPEFKMIGGLLENDVDVPVLGVKRDFSEVTEIVVSVYKDDEEVPFGNQRLKIQDKSSHKCEHISGNGTYPSKKERRLSDLMAGNCSYLPNGDNESAGKAGRKLISSSSGKRDKAVDSIYDVNKMLSWPRESSKVGESICRVASQLTGSIPIFKGGDEMSQKSTGKNKNKNNDSPARASMKAKRRRKVIPAEYYSADEMLSQLCSAARDPLKGYSFLISIILFFSEFRKSVSLDHSSLDKCKKSLGKSSGNKTGLESSSSDSEQSEFEGTKDSYWTDRIIESIPEEQLSLENQNETGEFLPEIPSDKVMPTAKLQAASELSPNLDSKGQNSGGGLEMEAEGAADYMDEKCKEEHSATALILIFTDLDSVPSETNLNKIFSHYGPLKESETKVMKKSNRAKVVFKRRSDAETAFSSAGKFSIFGPSLVSYRLKYSPSTPPKASSRATKRSRKDATSVEGSAT